jgi:hypothetical protein
MKRLFLLLCLLVSLLQGCFVDRRTIANASAAVGVLRQIHVANADFYAVCGTYADSLHDLSTETSKKECVRNVALNPLIASADYVGYQFRYDVDRFKNKYRVWANPREFGVSGDRGFYTDQTGVIRQNMDGPASAQDPPLE